MSYILDALRKADAERERGHVPGIHAQPAFGSPAPAPARAAATPWGWIGAGVVILVLLAALAWSLLRGAPREVVAQAPVGPAVAPTPSAVAPTAPSSATTMAAVPAPAAVTQTAPARPAPALAKPAPAPAPVARAPKPAVARPSPATPAAAETGAAQAAPAAATAASANRVYAVNELPDDIRRQLPVITVGGSMYSSTPGNRILIVNGQVLHEGDRIGPELVLSQIKVKAAVLAFRGYRYEIAF
ncbi:general secretion pathway protein GspB [Rhizobacter fulvus]